MMNTRSHVLFAIWTVLLITMTMLLVYPPTRYYWLQSPNMEECKRLMQTPCALGTMPKIQNKDLKYCCEQFEPNLADQLNVFSRSAWDRLNCWGKFCPK